MRSDSVREKERESNSIFSFVEETKTRLILSRQMDNSSEDILLARWRKLATRRGGDENLSIGFSINRYQRNRFGEKYSDKAIMVLFYSVVHCSLLPFQGRKRVCTCVKLISLKQTVRFIRRASYLLKYCFPSPLPDRLYSSILESRFHDFPSTYFRHFRVRARDTGEMLFSCKIKSYYPSTTLSLIVASSFDPLFRHFGQAIYFFFFFCTNFFKQTRKYSRFCIFPCIIFTIIIAPR